MTPKQAEEQMRRHDAARVSVHEEETRSEVYAECAKIAHDLAMRRADTRDALEIEAAIRARGNHLLLQEEVRGER